MATAVSGKPSPGVAGRKLERQSSGPATSSPRARLWRSRRAGSHSRKPQQRGREQAAGGPQEGAQPGRRAIARLAHAAALLLDPRGEPGRPEQPSRLQQHADLRAGDQGDARYEGEAPAPAPDPRRQAAGEHQRGARQRPCLRGRSPAEGHRQEVRGRDEDHGAGLPRGRGQEGRGRQQGEGERQADGALAVAHQPRQAALHGERDRRVDRRREGPGAPVPAAVVARQHRALVPGAELLDGAGGVVVGVVAARRQPPEEHGQQPGKEPERRPQSGHARSHRHAKPRIVARAASTLTAVAGTRPGGR
ncbi:MAG: hypothetical protein MUE90_15335 [Thermoanaerobaculales bacterium]|nr:hypothetical protein [Thermoanaerobaculales bacterium]